MTPETKELQLIPVTAGIYFIPDATNIGVITETRHGITDVWLVDSGYSPDIGQRILNLLKKTFPSFNLQAIFCTHSHADHINGNAYLAEQTGCGIWITKGEQANLEYPLIEQAIICGGYPFPELKTPFYQARPSTATRLITPGETYTLPGGTKLEFISMPGHHIEMTAVLVTAENGKRIFFAGDAIFGRERMKKYWIPFLFDVGGFKDSLKHIAGIQADYYLPSHGELLTEIESLTELNRIAILSTEKCILHILEVPHTAEEVLKAVADEHYIPLGLGQFILIGSTVRSYLAYLYRSSLIRYTIKDNRMLWEKIPDHS